MQQNTQRPRRRLRRAAFVFAGFVVLIWLLLQFVVLNANLYGPMLFAAIERETGLPASASDLELDVLTGLRFTARGVRLGADDFKAAADRLVVTASLPALLSRRIDIHRIDVTGLQLTVPDSPGALADRIEEIQERFGQGEGGGGGFGTRIGSIRVTDATIVRARDDHPFMTLTTTISDVLAQEIGVAVDARLLQYGEGAAASADLAILLTDESRFDAVVGTARVTDVQTETLPVQNAPEGVLNAEARFERPSPRTVDLVLDGTLASDTHTALAGSLSSQARWADGLVEVRQASWSAPGVEVKAAGSRDAGGKWTGTVTEAVLTDDALGSLIHMAATENAELHATGGASLNVTDLTFEYDSDSSLRFLQGSVTGQGIQVVTAEQEPILTGIDGEIVVDDGLIRLAHLRGDGLRIQGTIQPDFQRSSIRLDLSGSLELRPTLAAAFGAKDSVGELSGTLAVDEFVGTFAEPGQIPEDLVVNGTIQDGRVGLITEADEFLFAPVSASFATTADRVTTKLTAQVENSSTFAVDGAYSYEAREWTGTVAGNLQEIVAQIFLDADQAETVRPLLAPYRDVRLRATVSTPSDATRQYAIHAVRQEGAHLEARASFPQTTDGYALGPIEAEAVLPLAELEPGTFGDLELSGDAQLAFVRHEDTESFTVTADFRDSLVRVSERVRKQPGDTFRIEVAGTAGDEWAAETLSVALLEEHLSLAFGENGLEGRDLQLRADRLTGLFHEGSSARGVVTADITSEPLYVDVRFDSVRLTVDDEFHVDHLDGHVRYADEGLTVHDLVVRAANTDVIVNAGHVQDRWEGRLTGKSLDLNTVEAFYEGVWGTASEEVPDDEPTTEPAGEPFIGNFTVELDRLRYNRAEATAVRANTVFDESGVHVRDIAFTPYTGSISGTVDILRNGDAADTVSARMQFEQIDLRFIDDLAFEETREFFGTGTGTISFDAPTGSVEEMLAAGNGEAVWAAKEGSFGRIGWASKFLTVLRTTEIIEFRAPSLRDKGLTYEVCAGRIDMTNGVMVFNETVLSTPSYAMEVNGDLDFAQEKSDVIVFVRVLERVASLAENIPLVRRLTELTTDNIGTAIGISGSPYDPKFAVRPDVTATRMVTGPAEAGGEIIKDLVTAPVDALKGLFGGKRKEESQETPPAEGAESP